MKFKDFFKVFSDEVYFDVTVVDGKTKSSVADYGFNAFEYHGELCDKLDLLDVHFVQPYDYKEIRVYLLEG